MGHLTARIITKQIQDIIKKVHTFTMEDEISHFSVHSLCIWVAFLLSEAGKDDDYIKDSLHWPSDALQVYPQNTRTYGTNNILKAT